jgi:hypothetical protein
MKVHNASLSQTASPGKNSCQRPVQMKTAFAFADNNNMSIVSQVRTYFASSESMSSPTPKLGGMNQANELITDLRTAEDAEKRE